MDLTLIPHAMVFASLAILAWRVLEMGAAYHGGTPPAESNSVPSALIILIGMMVIERSYYIAARTLIHYEINLWTAHPGPMMISLGIVVGVYQCVPAVMRRTGHAPGVVRRAVVRDCIMLVAIAVIVALFVLGSTA